MSRPLSVSTSKRIVNQRKQYFIRWVKRIILLVTILWAGLIGLSYTQWGKIDRIIILKNPHIDTLQAQQEIQEVMDTHWPIMGNHDRHWTLPRKKITAIIHNQSNTIRSTSIQYRDHALVLGTEVYTPAFITCFTDDSCGFTSHDGYVYDQSPDFSDGVYPIFEIIKKAPIYDHGPLILSETQRMIVDTILMNTETLWGTPHRVVMDLLDVHIFFDSIDGVSVSSRTFVTIGQQHVQDYETYISERLNALKEKTNFFERLHGGQETLEYLDLRFDEKIYMKFSDEL